MKTVNCNTSTKHLIIIMKLMGIVMVGFTIVRDYLGSNQLLGGEWAFPRLKDGMQMLFVPCAG